MNTSCQNCQFIYNHKIIPYQLSCKHSFCAKCLYGQFDVKQNLQFQNYKRKCFKCQQQSLAKYNSTLHQIALKTNKYIKGDKLIQVCLIGSANVGKSSLMKRLTKNIFNEKSFNTIGFDIDTIVRTIGQYEFVFNMYDTAGTQKYRSVLTMHYKRADIVLIVYDVSQSIESNGLQYWVGQVEGHSNTRNIIIVGNKCDMARQKQINELQNECIIRAKKLSEIKKWKHLTISCKQGDRILQLWNNLDEMGVKLINNFIKKGYSSIISGGQQDIKQKQKEQNKKKAKGCC